MKVKIPHQEYLKKDKIWVLKQNKPKYVANDLEKFGVPREVTHAVLLARGVYKWLAVRRKLIKLKDQWKKEITTIQNEISKLPRKSTERKILAERLKTLTKCRQEIRKLCHSPRWQAPDFDKEAQAFLKWLEGLDKI